MIPPSRIEAIYNVCGKHDPSAGDPCRVCERERPHRQALDDLTALIELLSGRVDHGTWLDVVVLYERLMDPHIKALCEIYWLDPASSPSRFRVIPEPTGSK